MTQPPDAQAFPKPLACALAKIHSFAPPAAFGFEISLTGEHPVVALDNAGPVTTVPNAPAVIGIRYSVGGPAVFPQTYRFPVAFTEARYVLSNPPERRGLGFGGAVRLTPTTAFVPVVFAAKLIPNM
jgi:hypothetical protein